MSVEFRLKYIRESINKNINDILLKWNARKVFLNEPFDEETKDQCPACLNAGKHQFLKYSYVNIDEAVYKCENSACLYPYRDFKYKNYVDRTIFRYERNMETDESKTELKIFTSPTKMESDDLDHFNLSWLDNSLPDDLDSILTTPSEGRSSDIKDIINSICNNVDATPKHFNSPSRLETEQSPRVPAPKLSKCLQYIEHLSPTKQERRISQECPSNGFIGNNEAVPVFTYGHKSWKKNRPGLKKNHRVEPEQLTVTEQTSLGFLDWLDAVSKIEPEQMHEFELASPTQLTESSQIDFTNSTENSSDSIKTQPVLIELLGTSYVLNDHQLSNSSEPCSSISGHLEDSITTQTLEKTLSGDQNSAAANAGHSTFVYSENISSDFQIIKTKVGSDSSRSKQDNTKLATAKLKDINKALKEDLKLQKKIERIKRKMEKQKQESKKKPAKQVLVNEKTFDNEEEVFRGFDISDTVRSFTLRSKPLLWLKN